jgi:hypothetical protein
MFSWLFDAVLRRLSLRFQAQRATTGLCAAIPRPCMFGPRRPVDVPARRERRTFSDIVRVSTGMIARAP